MYISNTFLVNFSFSDQFINLQWRRKQTDEGGGGAKLSRNIDKQKKSDPYGYI